MCLILDNYSNLIKLNIIYTSSLFTSTRMSIFRISKIKESGSYSGRGKHMIIFNGESVRDNYSKGTAKGNIPRQIKIFMYSLRCLGNRLSEYSKSFNKYWCYPYTTIISYKDSDLMIKQYEYDYIVTCKYKVYNIDSECVSYQLFVDIVNKRSVYTHKYDTYLFNTDRHNEIIDIPIKHEYILYNGVATMCTIIRKSIIDRYNYNTAIVQKCKRSPCIYGCSVCIDHPDNKLYFDNDPDIVNVKQNYSTVLGELLSLPGLGLDYFKAMESFQNSADLHM